MDKAFDIAVIGGGAAGYFAAIHAAIISPSAKILVLESGAKPLAKVEISGGGRCNVTHHCFDIDRFVESYPRGAATLRELFKHFQARDTVQWFESRGVKLKAEEDGRMFPVSDRSQTVIDCLEQEARKHKLCVRTKAKVVAVRGESDKFLIDLKEGATLSAKAVILAPGGSSTGHSIAESFGHAIESVAPSLFTFKIDDGRIEDLSGVSFPTANLSLELVGGEQFQSSGPLLITHWGMSGPAILKLSAWAARELKRDEYRAELRVNFLGEQQGVVWDQLTTLREQNPKKKPRTTPLESVPKRFWLSLLESCRIREQTSWAELGNKSLKIIHQELTNGAYRVWGKGAFKEEFVTCGGVSLNEICLPKMESKLVPGLFIAGEVLDIDGLTGGFNFQSAWTTGYLAGKGAGIFLKK